MNGARHRFSLRPLRSDLCASALILLLWLLPLRSQMHGSESNDRPNSRSSNASRSSRGVTSGACSNAGSHRRARSRTRSPRRPENQTQETHHARMRRKRRQRQALLRPSKTLVRLPKRNRSASRQKSRNLSLRILPDHIQAGAHTSAAQLHDSLLALASGLGSGRHPEPAKRVKALSSICRHNEKRQ